MGGRIKDILVQKILGIEDTPHRIAWGVFLGCLVGATPTLGLQILIYIAAATLLRANKVSGIPFVLLTNPITALPLYYYEWRLGLWLMGEGAGTSAKRSEVFDQLSKVTSEMSWPMDLFTTRFWGVVFDAIVAMGAELWIGCLVIGLGAGAVAYAATYWGVIRFREVRAVVKARASLPPPPPTVA